MSDFKDYQSELFDEFNSGEPKQRKLRRPADYPRKINLSVSREKLIFSGIFVILLFIISFSLGIERGKKIAFRQVSEGSIQQSANTARVADTQNQSQQGIAAEDNQSLAQQKGVEIEPTIKAGKTAEAKREEDLREFYTLQAAAYSNLSRAQKEAKKVQDEGYKTTIDSSGKYHILLIGKYKSKSEAVAIKKKLAKRYTGCYVRKYTVKEN
jgi:cell division septation protein DedD